jgi:diguanylate cyclase (GGDEF)-like protein
VLLPGADAQRATIIAEELRCAVAVDPQGGLPVTMSFGVTGSPPGEFDYEKAIVLADRALYQAKAAGRNRVETFDGDEQTGSAVSV